MIATIPLYNPLKSPVGVHVHKTAYGPLIDTALYLMLLMQPNPLLGQVGGGSGPGNLNIFGAIWLDSISQDPKQSQFPGPLPLGLVMDLPASKGLSTGPHKS
jgi:hypothetical protein